MGKKKEVPVEEEMNTEVGEKGEAAPTPAKAKEIVVKYRDHQGKPTERTFSREVHGEDFAKLADEFKETNKSKIIE